MMKVVEGVDGFPHWRPLCCGSPTFPRARRDRRSRVRRTEIPCSQGAQRPGTAGATAGEMANGGFIEKGPLIGMYARPVDARCLFWLSVL